MPRDYQTAYLAALAADEALSRELARVYGSDACNARYRYHYDDERVRTAAQAKHSADNLLHSLTPNAVTK